MDFFNYDNHLLLATKCLARKPPSVLVTSILIFHMLVLHVYYSTQYEGESSNQH